MKICEIRWKSSEDKKPAWNQANVSVGAAGRSLLSCHWLNIHTPGWFKIYENLWTSMKYDESLQRTRSQPGIEQRFLQEQRVAPYGLKYPCPEIHENLRKCMKIYKIRWNLWTSMKSMKIYETLGNRWKSWISLKKIWNRAPKSPSLQACQRFHILSSSHRALAKSAAKVVACKSGRGSRTFQASVSRSLHKLESIMIDVT